MAHHHFTAAERLEISLLKKKGYSNRAIANELGCSHTSIGRELKRNAMEKGYDPRCAKAKARVRRKRSKYQGMWIEERRALRTYVIDKLEQHWTPEEISGRLKEVDIHLSYVSAKGIYKWLYSAWGQGYCHLLPKQRYRPKKRRGKKAGRQMIPNRIGIEERPKAANSREEFGHYETDTVVSPKRHDSTVSLSVLHERRARFTRLRKLPNLKPSVHAKTLQHVCRDLVRKTITYDNGIENRDHETVAEALNIRTFFCNPYHSWEKGSVENTIGRIRRFIPKKANLAEYTDDDIARIEHWLNHTPRKCLRYKTPYEIMTENNLLVFVSSDS